MSGNLFIPKVYKEESVEAVIAVEATPDKVGMMIMKAVQYLVATLLFLLPLFFVPGLPASLGFDKVLLSAVLGFSALMLISLSALRYSKTSTVIPLSLLLFWGFVAVSFLGGLLTGDIQDALRGSVFEPQTVGFFAVMALVMALPLALQQSKLMSLRALVFFGSASTLIIGYTLLRIVAGSDKLSLGSFPTVTLSPVGGFNDIAIFSALTIILALITLLQLPLRKGIQAAISALIVAALMILAVVNFFHLWLVIGFFGLLLLVYILAKDTFLYHSSKEVKSIISPILIGITMLVCITSIVFVIAGDYMGAKISSLTEISYVEVRPSVTATIDVARNVYQDDVLLGVGPNRFADAWRLHKDRSINETLFWDTDFNAGFGFVPTIFVTLGLLGGMLFVAFHVAYLYLGYRMLVRTASNDSFWSFFGTVTFTAAVFLWGMTYVYVPGATILLLASLFTGLSFVSYQALVPSAIFTIPLVSNRQRGLLVMALVIIVIVSSVSALFTIGNQYMAQAQFTEARISSTTPEEFEQSAGNALAQYQDDVFANALAQTKLTTLSQMLAITEPTQADQERFVATAGAAIEYASRAITLDESNPDPHATLAEILIVLARAGITDAEGRANDELAAARNRDPLSPTYSLIAAYMAVQAKDIPKARQEIAAALELKNNYSEALFLLTQLDISEGKIESAIATTRQITTLEPNNPTRYYQLGVLLAANKDYIAAITAYQTAITQDPNFANARYMLAMSYLDSNQLDNALTQLRIVRETNGDNQQLQTLISQLETSGIPTVQSLGLETPINETTPNQNPDDSVASPVDPNTNLVTPVNTINTADAATETPEPAL